MSQVGCGFKHKGPAVCTGRVLSSLLHIGRLALERKVISLQAGTTMNPR